MIRPFDLLDVPLLAQLESQGRCLFSEYALTRKTRPIQAALAGFFSLYSRGAYTVVSPNAPAGFAQMRTRATGPRAIVTFVAPNLAAGNGAAEVWGPLLEALASAAGEMGLHRLVAEAPDEGLEVAALQRSGFAVLLHQSILQRKAGVATSPPNDLSLRPCADSDSWGIQQLYLNTAPQLAQQAETPPRVHHSGPVRGYVLEEGGEVIAYLEIRRGPAGAWFNTWIHPQAEQCAARVLARGLALLGPRWSAPVYCCMRQYQEWLSDPLQSLGFEPLISTAVMVKRLVVPVAEPERARAHALVQPKVTTPIVRSKAS